MSESSQDGAVFHNKAQQRFEVLCDGYTAELNYQMSGSTIIFTRTNVPTALEGRGLGKLLVSSGLQYARDNNLQVQSQCWFVDKYRQRHPQD